ncbi:MAG TPA: amidohydrolase family protein [Terrimicrobiaceae bacterium]|nr:amidohydrolase family protein [Terrimicrobiaceae bacterium]
MSTPLKLQTTKLVDSHQHAFFQGHDDRYLVRDMDSLGINYSWLLTWEIPPGDPSTEYVQFLNPFRVRPDGTHPGIVLEDLILVQNRHPNRFVLGYCPAPTVSKPWKLLRAAHDMYGVRVCGEWKFRIPFDDPRCLELFRAAGKLNMPVVLHLDVPYLKNPDGVWNYQSRWYGGTVANLERALEACPETVFIGHAPGFWREIGLGADEVSEAYPEGIVSGEGRLYRLFDSYPNLYADLSASGFLALRRDQKHARTFLTRFQDRLLFGRDFCDSNLYDLIASLDLETEVLENICWRNAEKLVLAP